MGGESKDVAVAASAEQLRAFVCTDLARSAWQLCCLPDLAAGPEGQSVQEPYWEEHTVPYCKPGRGPSPGMG